MNRPYIKPDVIKKVKNKRMIEKRKLNRPHIKADVIKKVKLRKIEEEKAALKRQREFVFEQQRHAFLQQQAKMIIDKELEEENGMSM